MSSTKTPELDKRQSTLIKAMRFPLIVLVVFAHSLGSHFYKIDYSLDGWNIYHFFSEMISHNLCKIAVCWFFVIAGYFYFFNSPDEGISWKWLSDKWKRRIYTLLIPYVVWNLLFVLLIFIKTHTFALLGITQNEPVCSLFQTAEGPLYWLFTGPVDFPLWFMRDLMILCLLSPLLYWLFKYSPKFISIVLLIILFVLPDTPIPAWRSYFFFSIGAYLGVQRYNMLALCKKVKWPAAILSLIILIISTIYNGASFHGWLLRLFYPFGMITFLNICDRSIDNDNRRELLSKLSACVFFIYAAHAVYILNWTKGLSLRIFGDGLLGSWISYFFVPIVVLAVCMGLYFLLNAIMPHPLAIACGGRSKK